MSFRFIFFQDFIRQEQSFAVAERVQQWVEEKDVSVEKPTTLIPIVGGFDNGKPVQIQDLSPMLGYPYLFQVLY